MSIAASKTADAMRLTDRKGAALVGHGDYEIAYVGCSLGLGMGVFPELKMTHLIPKERVSEKYLLQLAEANQISGGLLDYKWLGEPPPDPLSVRGILGMVKNVVLTGGFHRKHHLALMRGRIKAKRKLRCLQSLSKSILDKRLRERDQLWPA